jgi:hypothetical protein
VVVGQPGTQEKTLWLTEIEEPKAAGEGARATLKQKEKANLISQTGLYLCRQLEALRSRERAPFARGSLLPKS